jgi:beta-N-acetylhexosaminidase
MQKSLQTIVGIVLVLVLLISGGMPVRHSAAQQNNWQAEAEALLAAMTPAQRVGQLFLVTFVGDSAPNDSDIASLITEFHVGGVVLLRQNDNITGYGNVEDVPVQVAELVNDLQRLALTGVSTAPLQSGLLDEDAVPPTSAPPPPETAVPLFVAINQEGDGYPYSHISSGLTQIPSNMAIGATWNPAFSRNVGEVLGEELSALGVNLLLGPSLDVLEDPNPTGSSDLGTRTFGGDPYWVGVMGQAFTTGVHEGSNGRIGVIPKHFPGNGDSDRPIEQEIPTVRKSLEQLKQIELAPFFAVTGQTDPAAGTADGLLITHIRYQGFQGNIRATTNPVSFDPQALSNLMALPEFTGWREAGGIIVSDALGYRSVEQFYDVTGREFPHRRVAKDAFLAGNDLLYLASFALGDGAYELELANIKDTIRWFQEKYETDQSFQQRVDESVLRILSLKLKLYDGQLSPENVLVDVEGIKPIIVGNQNKLVDLAQAAITLIAPSAEELPERLPSPPGLNDRIVIFTDVMTAQQCSFCPSEPMIGEGAIEDRIVTLYGPEASEQIQPRLISSFSFADLAAFLNANGPIAPPSLPPTAVPDPDATATPEGAPTATAVPTPTPSPAYQVQEALRRADWIIFGLLDGHEGQTALNQFLAQRQDLAVESQVIVFAFGAPYHLDSTEISKLTAYYGVYSKIDNFIDAAVRALFQDLPLTGSSPVDIDGISYDLFARTQPDPSQIIELFLLSSNDETIAAGPNQEPQQLFVGDTLRLQTGVIVDYNGNPVPDGTLVQFLQLDRVAGLVNIIQEVPTVNGVASLDYVLEARTGQFRITAVSGDATLSREVDIAIEGEEQVAVSIPTLAPTPTAVPVATATAPLASTETAVPQPTDAPTTQSNVTEPVIRIELSALNTLIAMLVGLTAVIIIGVSIGRQKQLPITQKIRWTLWSVSGALILYIYYQLNLPGAELIQNSGAWAGFITTLLGGAISLFLISIRQN